jgi:hypothetical protein
MLHFRRQTIFPFRARGAAKACLLITRQLSPKLILKLKKFLPMTRRKKAPQCQMDGNVPTIMDAAATGIGFGFDQFMGHLEDVWEATPAGQAVEKYGKALGFANAVLAYGKFLMTYAALETKLVLEDAPPLIRTKNANRATTKSCAPKCG